MTLTPERLREMKARAEQGWVTPWRTVDPEDWPPEDEPFMKHLQQLQRDNLALIAEVERLWGERDNVG
jgi:hypothetical protein